MSTDAIRSRLLSPVSSISQTAFSNRLEKHIDDVKSGLGNLDSGINYELAEKSASLSSSLSQTDPKAASLYAGYSSFMRYDSAARFTSNLEYANRVQQSVQSKDEVQKQVDALVANLTGKSSDGKTVDASTAPATTDGSSATPATTDSSADPAAAGETSSTTTATTTPTPVQKQGFVTYQDQIIAESNAKRAAAAGSVSVVG